MSLACGPAKEVQKFLNDYDDKISIKIDLVDQDLSALQNAQMNIKEILVGKNFKKLKINFINNAVKNIIQQGLENKDYYDLIYSAGLFDYLTENVAIACMKRLYAALAPEGKMIIGNFNVSNPSRFIMEHILDWNLIHRSDEEMKALGLKISSDVHVEYEEEKINLFLIITKNGK